MGGAGLDGVAAAAGWSADAVSDGVVVRLLFTGVAPGE